MNDLPFEDALFREAEAIELMTKGVNLLDIAKKTGLPLDTLETLRIRFDIKVVH